MPFVLRVTDYDVQWLEHDNPIIFSQSIGLIIVLYYLNRLQLPLFTGLILMHDLIKYMDNIHSNVSDQWKFQVVMFKNESIQPISEQADGLNMNQYRN